jgi:hypothetical protein
MEKLKYIKTDLNEIIIFPMSIEHSSFKNFSPVSAGFCVIRNNYDKVDCYGESHSLELQSDVKADTLEATKHVFGIDAMIKLI